VFFHSSINWKDSLLSISCVLFHDRDGKNILCRPKIREILYMYKNHFIYLLEDIFKILFSQKRGSRDSFELS